jgi:hypothetical protein
MWAAELADIVDRLGQQLKDLARVWGDARMLGGDP